MLEELASKVRLERWKETPLQALLATSWRAPIAPADPLLSDILPPHDAVVITLCNGAIDSRWFDDRQLPDGLLVSSSAENHLNIRVIRHSVIEKPIMIHHIVQADSKGSIHVYPQINIELEEHSKASILFIESGEGHYLTQPKVQVILKERAALEWIKVSLNADQSASLFNGEYLQEAKSTLKIISYQSRGALVRSDITMKSLGEKTHTEFFGLNLGKGKQHLAHVMNLEHQVPRCTSVQQIKNLLNDQSEALFDGMIHVYQDAQKIDADQLTRSILLGEKARALTIPRLEIYADDVRCTHGATIGFLEPDQLYYLRSRGIDLDAAKQMLMRAYALEIVEAVDSESVKTWLLHTLDEDLTTLNK